MVAVENDETDGLTTSHPYYEKNFHGHLPLHWLQPKDQNETTLPSFRDLQLKTHQTLYGTTNSTIVPPRDKSPKGSVDAPIRHLVDLINSHSRFCTLSSCSGRLSLFDPNGNAQEHCDNDEPVSNFTEASGKGRGSWVLVSHDPVPPKALVEAMTTNDTKSTTNDTEEEDLVLKPWTFRFEPMLLHIAAACLNDGRRLLTIALNLGFRESGLVVTDKRVTVAIRSHSLSTATPLFPNYDNSELCVPPSYLRALVIDANERLEANWKHLDRLYRSIESVLFEVRSSPPPLVVRNHPSSSSIPSLNLWNAASIVGADSKQQVWIVGGYGCGPTDAEKLPSAKRSNNLYKLAQDTPNGSWSLERMISVGKYGKNCGESDVLEVSNKTPESKSTFRVHWWKEGTFPDLQGMASCRWTESISLFWGGRKSPSNASDALLVLDASNGCRMGTIQDIRGDMPKARWGHQLIALDGNRAVLLGGCNQEDGVFDDVFVLHYCDEECESNSNDKNVGYFNWERLSIRLPTPRFHFGATLLHGDTIIVLGGLESTRELLRPFECDTESTSSASAVWACKIGASKRKSTSTVPNTQATVVKVETPGNSSLGSFECFFGMACCTLLSKNLMLVTGGIQSSASNSTSARPMQAYWVSDSDSSTLRIQRIGHDYDLQKNCMEEPSYDFGALVHHCCIPLADNELLLVGGGVPSFAFGECYARSHHLVIDTDSSCREQKSAGTTNLNSDRNESLLSANSANLQGQKNSANDGGEAKEIANVLYVSPQHARQTKNSLLQRGWLEKRYRMIKVERKSKESVEGATPQRMIALPISVPFSEAIEVFGEFILDHGEEELPLSTSQYASKTKQKKR